MAPPKAKPTHFLCLPLITPTSRPQLEQSLAHFREITKEGDCRIPASAYRPLGVLHLTLGVMTLTPERLEDALELLQIINPEGLLRENGDTERARTSTVSDSSVSAPREQKRTSGTTPIPQTLHRPNSPLPPSTPTAPLPLTLSLRGLSAFPTSQRATVLYASPHDPSNRLYPFSLLLRQAFIDAGFMQQENRPLALHATVVNTVYSTKSSERTAEKGRGRGRGRISMDAGGWMSEWNGTGDGRGNGEGEGEEFIWAENVVIDRVRVCRMGAKAVEDAVLGMEYEVVGEKMILGGGEG